MSSAEDSDDLDSRPRKRAHVPSNQHFVRSSPSISFSDATDLDAYGDDEPPRKRPRKVTEPQAYQFSDSEGEDAGETAARRYKNKSADHRKKSIAATKKAKRIVAENERSIRKKDEGRTGVGKQSPRRRKKDRNGNFDDGLPSDEEGMDHTMPDYIRRRRNDFNDRSERLREHGLALPPSYQDVSFSDDERVKYLKERPILPSITPPAKYEDIELPYSLGIIPAAIAQYLREYQVKGAAFMHELFVYQKGGILGDDMGLGKTIQVIAFLTAAYGKTGDERDKKRMRKMRRAHRDYPRTLIICPGSLMANWQDEMKTWGWWHTELFHGSAKEREDVLAQAKAGMIEVMITTYTTYRMHKDKINTVSWDCVIADECHIIKERTSAVTKAMNEVNALCRVGLTGTAIQNKYEELWTLLNWTNPGRFGPVSQWKVTISEPLNLGQSHNATIYELARARLTARKLVDNLLPQFFLRRMKSLIRDQLPKKTDRVVFCPLTPIQADAYRNFLESDYVETIKYSSDLCACGSGKKQGWCCRMFLENGDTWQQWTFPCIHYLQRMSNHLALLIPSSSDSKEKQAKDTEILEAVVPDRWQELVESRDSIINYSNPEFCGKWRVLKKLLKFWHDQGGQKVLVFSHSVRLLKMLQSLFIHTSYTVKYLDGSMTYEDRYNAVKDFNSDPTQFVFLISTRAGGVGLNITSANKVVVVDPNWNPSYDLQAQDRAYRIGQTRDVEVFRLVGQGTLEEIVYARQIYKQQMSSIGLTASSERRYFTGVQDRKEMKGEIFGLRNLFAYQDENVVLKGIMHKTNVAEAKADLKFADLDIDEELEDDDDHEEDNDGVTTRANSQAKADKEDAAMSQLAAEIIGEAAIKKRNGGKAPTTTSSGEKNGFSKRHDPVQAILAAAGVSYTHENSEVVGSSRVEAALSKRATEASNHTQRESRVFFADPQSRGQNTSGEHYIGDEQVSYKYRPPDDVMRRQFVSMAEWAGHGKDVVEFALIVEGWTQARRREFLEGWYRWRRECLVNGSDGVKREEDAKQEVVYKQEPYIKFEKVEVKGEKNEVDIKVQETTDSEDDEL